MPDHELHHLLAIAVEDVLETMFFSETFGSCETEARAAQLEARVAFSGASSGSVAVRISESSARSLAASFLGEAEESLGDAQVSQVVCEVANMLCGSIVTKMESQGCFDLGAPELYPDSNQQVVTSAAVQQSFAIERGTLTVSLMSGESA
jgi:CheY-specific phosphatase CheX